MNLYQPTITGSLSVSGSVIVNGTVTAATISGSLSGTASTATTASYAVVATSASYAASASNALAAQSASYVLNAVSSSYILNAQSASIATTALTASSADNFLVRNTLTAQTLVVQTITSSVDFVTGSTRFGSVIGNTHQFTGSVLVSGSVTSQGGFILGNSATIAPTGSIGYNNAVGVFIYGKSGSEADFRLYNKDGLTAMSVVAGTQNINFNGSITAGSLSRIGDVFVGGRSGTYATYTDGVFGDNLHLGATSTGGAVYINTALSRNLIINPVGGNVGIGTNSPASFAGLHINKAGSTGMFISNTTGNTGGYLFAGGLGGLELQSVDSSNSVSKKLILQPYGDNVLIGTSSDNGNAKLQVNGNISFGYGPLLAGTATTLSTSAVQVATGTGIGVGAFYFVVWFNTTGGAQGNAILMARSGTLTTVSISDNSGTGVIFSVSGATLFARTTSGTVSMGVAQINL